MPDTERRIWHVGDTILIPETLLGCAMLMINLKFESLVWIGL